MFEENYKSIFQNNHSTFNSKAHSVGASNKKTIHLKFYLMLF